MSTIKLLPSLCFASIFSLNVIACEKPQAPEMPNPQTAVTPQMIKAKRDFQSYLAEAKTYLKCVGDDRSHNAMVDEMKTKAAAFNHIMGEYKKRMQLG
jgi:hypothetical protein